MLYYIFLIHYNYHNVQDHREQLLTALAAAETQNKEYIDELQQFKENDPDIIEAKRNTDSLVYIAI